MGSPSGKPPNRRLGLQTTPKKTQGKRTPAGRKVTGALNSIDFGAFSEYYKAKRTSRIEVRSQHLNPQTHQRQNTNQHREFTPFHGAPSPPFAGSFEGPGHVRTRGRRVGKGRGEGLAVRRTSPRVLRPSQALRTHACVFTKGEPPSFCCGFERQNSHSGGPPTN